jgi:hypothetical protein
MGAYYMIVPCSNEDQALTLTLNTTDQGEEVSTCGENEAGHVHECVLQSSHQLPVWKLFVVRNRRFQTRDDDYIEFLGKNTLEYLCDWIDTHPLRSNDTQEINRLFISPVGHDPVAAEQLEKESIHQLEEKRKSAAAEEAERSSKETQAETQQRHQQMQFGQIDHFVEATTANKNLPIVGASASYATKFHEKTFAAFESQHWFMGLALGGYQFKAYVVKKNTLFSQPIHLRDVVHVTHRAPFTSYSKVIDHFLGYQKLLDDTMAVELVFDLSSELTSQIEEITSSDAYKTTIQQYKEAPQVTDANAPVCLLATYKPASFGTMLSRLMTKHKKVVELPDEDAANRPVMTV